MLEKGVYYSCDAHQPGNGVDRMADLKPFQISLGMRGDKR